MDDLHEMDRPPAPTQYQLSDWLDVIVNFGGDNTAEPCGLEHPCFDLVAAQHPCWDMDYPTRHSTLMLIINHKFGPSELTAVASHHDEKECHGE